METIPNSKETEQVQVRHNSVPKSYNQENIQSVSQKNINDGNYKHVCLNHNCTQQQEILNDNDKSSERSESDSIETLFGLLDKLNKYKRKDDAEIFKFILKSLSNPSENVIEVKKGCKNTKEKKVLNNIIKILHEAGYSSEIISILTGQTSNMISNTIIKMQERKEIANCEITKKIATPETKLSDLLGEAMFGRALCEINYEKQQISIRAPLPVKS